MRVKKMMSVSIKKGETITVPSGEFWKGLLTSYAFGGRTNIMMVNGVKTAYNGGIPHRFEFTENTVIAGSDSDSYDCALQGLIFEL